MPIAFVVKPEWRDDKLFIGTALMGRISRPTGEKDIHGLIAAQSSFFGGRSSFVKTEDEARACVERWAKQALACV